MIKWSKVRFVRAGHGPDSPIMYVIIMNRTEHGNWKVETCPCDHTGSPVSDPVFWDIFPLGLRRNIVWISSIKNGPKQ